MLPLISPPPDENETGEHPQMSSALAAALGVAVFAMLLAVFMAAGRATSVVLPGMMVILIVLIGAFMFYRMRRQATPDKSKRVLAEMDMYSLINRLVDDLNDDELAYLERQIEERKRQHDRSVIQDVGQALAQRDEARRAATR